MESALDADTAHLKAVWTEANRRIEQMPDETHRTLLRLRYLAGMTFARIAEEMHYSERQIYRTHEEALEAFGRKWRKELRKGSK